MLHEHRFRAMNTEVGIWLWSTSRTRDAAIRGAVRAGAQWFRRAEAELSRFRPDSGLSRLNRAAGRGPQVVSPLLWTVLRSALAAADDTGGLYDPTLCRTLEHLGYDRSFEAVERDGSPHPHTPVPSTGGWRRVRVIRAARSVSLPADVAVDLGGIAKGWTVDRVATALAPLGPVLVDAGGDLRVVGAVDGEPWPIAVQDPFEPARDRALVRLSSGALATSSRGGRCWHRGGRLLHHVIDPRTGTSAESDLHTVTVHAPSAMAADVAAKVALVLGGDAGARYLAQQTLSARLTATDGRETIVGHVRWEEGEFHVPTCCA